MWNEWRLFSAFETNNFRALQHVQMIIIVKNTENPSKFHFHDFTSGSVLLGEFRTRECRIVNVENVGKWIKIEDFFGIRSMYEIRVFIRLISVAFHWHVLFVTDMKVKIWSIQLDATNSFHFFRYLRSIMLVLCLLAIFITTPQTNRWQYNLKINQKQ